MGFSIMRHPALGRADRILLWNSFTTFRGWSTETTASRPSSGMVLEELICR